MYSLYKKSVYKKTVMNYDATLAGGHLQADSLSPARRSYTVYSLRVTYKRDLKEDVLDTFDVILR